MVRHALQFDLRILGLSLGRCCSYFPATVEIDENVRFGLSDINDGFYYGSMDDFPTARYEWVGAVKHQTRIDEVWHEITIEDPGLTRYVH